MPRERLREFDRQFSADVVPGLCGQGFVAGKDRSFRRGVEHEQTRSIQIVEFQIGRGRSIGRFTVNLAVFNRDYLPPSWPLPDGEPISPGCLLVERLGFLRPPHRTLVDLLSGRHPEARDHWWRQSDNPRVMRRELAEVMSILLTDGLRWLDTRTSLRSFQWALRQLERRKEWKMLLASHGAPPVFTPEPFPE